MDVRMVLQFLIPGVKHAEESDLGAEILCIASDFEQGFGAGAEQEGVNDLLVLQRQRGKLMRKREDDMGIAGRQQFFLPIRQPAFPRVALALRAMPVST